MWCEGYYYDSNYIWFSIIAYIVVGIIMGCLTNVIIRNKGYSDSWFWWGFFFHYFAMIFAAAKPEYRPNYMDGTVRSKSLDEKSEKEALAEGGWKCCRCERINPGYTGSCACGMTKSENEDQKKKIGKLTQEEETLRLLNSYKELLDNGVLTQEEFEKKKRNLLGM